MFLCAVNVGLPKEMDQHDKKMRIPPFLENSKTLRYDSVKNVKENHYIVYDNAKAYPGYLITYTK